MTFDGIEAEQQEVPPPPFRKRYEAIMLALGIALFTLLLISSWASESKQSGSGIKEAESARMQTYLVEQMLYRQLADGQSPLNKVTAESLPSMAKSAADDWRDLATEETGEYRAYHLLNAAALAGVAGDAKTAQRDIRLAASSDATWRASYRTLLPLYQAKPQAVTLSPDLSRRLDKLSTGPLFHARAALATGDLHAARIALLPGARAGQRVSMLGLFMLPFGLAVIGLAILFVALHQEKINGTFRILKLPSRFPAAWSIGTGLTLVSGVLLLTDLCSEGLRRLFHVSGNDPQAIRLILPLSALAEILVTVIVLGIFLRLRGKAPWQWSEFGWRTPGRGIRVGIILIIVGLPLVWLANWISSWLIEKVDKSALQSHPIIPILQNTHNLAVILTIVFMTVLMAPFVEETLFRGILFRAMDGRLSFWVAAQLSGLLFALVHGQLIAILPIFVLGTLFAFMMKRTQSLWASATAHAVFNGISTGGALLFAWALHGPGS